MGTYKFLAEFRAHAVVLCRSHPGCLVAALAMDLGVSQETLRLCIKAARSPDSGAVALCPAVWGAGQLVTGWWFDRVGRKQLIDTGMLL